MLSRTVFTASPLLGAVVISKSDAGEYKSTEKTPETLICRPSDLPLYRKPTHVVAHSHKDSKAFSSIEEGVRTVRVEVQNVTNSIASQKQNITDYVKEGQTQTKFIVEYLNQPDNTFPRIGAVAVGGLSGYIFGLRGGLFRRSLYGIIGATAIASICYPKEAQIYAQQGIGEAKKLATIGYNFAYGVKPGDDVNGPEWPKFPTTLSEVGDSLSGMAQSVKQTIFSESDKKK